jgi:hypothetical protein
MGRAGTAGDEVGSAIIGSRLVRDLMRLCFLIEKQYPPFPKWFGTAFKHLKCAEGLLPLLRRVLPAQKWEERERLLSRLTSASPGCTMGLASLSRLPHRYLLSSAAPSSLSSLWAVLPMRFGSASQTNRLSELLRLD